jgi:hypothetical protein
MTRRDEVASLFWCVDAVATNLVPQLIDRVCIGQGRDPDLSSIVVPDTVEPDLLEHAWAKLSPGSIEIISHEDRGSSIVRRKIASDRIHTSPLSLFFVRPSQILSIRLG